MLASVGLGGLTACGGGSGSGAGGGGTVRYEVRVTVNDLDGSGLVLQNNSGDDLSVSAPGLHTFSTRLSDGSAFDVRVKTHPTMLQQTCNVSGGTGTVSGAAVTGITVTCVTPTPLFAYAANSNDAAGTNLSATGSVSAYKVGVSGSLTDAKVGGVWESLQRRPVSVVVDALAQFAYVARSGDSGATALVAYAINGNTGALTLRGGTSEYSSVPYPQAMAMSPSGTQLYVAGNGSGGGAQLVSHAVTSVSGGLGASSTAATWAGHQVSSLAVDPQGRFVVVGLTNANNTSNRLAVFRRNTSDGTLTAWSSLINLTGTPSALVIDPGGRWLYQAANGPTAGDHLVRAFELPADAANETLTAIGSATPVTGSPADLAVHPRGTFLYAVRQASTARKVSVFPIASGGGLGAEVVEANAGDHGTGISPAQIRLDARGTYAYVTNTGGNTISIFSVDRSSGRLTPATPATVGTETEPIGLVLVAR